jgi:tRNA threonylcarbamoyladenosine biosynthesis protein TsaB
MQLLAIETATDICSVAYVQHDTVLSEVNIFEHRRHAELLAPAIEEQSKRHGIQFSDLDAVAVSIGPGSFTGLRIGLSVAKGLIFGTDIQLIAVPTLLASAWEVHHLTDRVGVIHHSHRDFYFYAEYAFDEHLSTKSEPRRLEFSELRTLIPDNLDIVCRVPAGDTNVSSLPNSFLSRESVKAGNIARLVLAHPDRWIVQEPFTTEPEYLKDYQAVKYKNPIAG